MYPARIVLRPKGSDDPKLYLAFQSRMEVLKTEIHKTHEVIDEMRDLLQSAEHLRENNILPDGASVAELRERLALQHERYKSLVTELELLEGFMERHAARKWRLINFILALVVGLGAGGVIGAWVRGLLLGQ
jgi:anaerobic ribonucleoside-triphosphate reductase